MPSCGCRNNNSPVTGRSPVTRNDRREKAQGERRLKKYGAQTFVYAPWHTLQSVRSQPANRIFR
jgi:hypothetical protein